jgi:hypothetical protein
MAEPTDKPRARRPRGSHKTRKPHLSAREVRFCVLWVELDNVTRSHKEAGYTSASDNAHLQAGKLLLRKPHIRAYIRRLQDDAARAAGVTLESIMAGFRRGEQANLAEVTLDDGTLMPFNQWPEHLQLATKSLTLDPVSLLISDPADPARMIRVERTRLKVVMEDRTECRKILAQITRVLGPDSETGRQQQGPLVIGGDASPDTLFPPCGKK